MSTRKEVTLERGRNRKQLVYSPFDIFIFHVANTRS